MMIDPTVRAGWLAFNRPLEGRVHTMYRDTKGFVTVGVGNLIDPCERALSLPWQWPEGATATRDEIADDWHRVRSMPPGLLAYHYATPDALTLSDDAIDALCMRQFDANAEQLKRTFPDFETWPAAVQQGALSMAWAEGAGFPAKFPKWSAGARALDWATCAAECGIPGSKDRSECLPRSSAVEAHPPPIGYDIVSAVGRVDKEVSARVSTGSGDGFGERRHASSYPASPLVSTAERNSARCAGQRGGIGSPSACSSQRAPVAHRRTAV